MKPGHLHTFGALPLVTRNSKHIYNKRNSLERVNSRIDRGLQDVESFHPQKAAAEVLAGSLAPNLTTTAQSGHRAGIGRQSRGGLWRGLNSNGSCSWWLMQSARFEWLPHTS